MSFAFVLFVILKSNAMFTRLLFLDVNLRRHLVGGVHEYWNFVPAGCDAIVSRIKSNLRTVELIFNLHFSIHHNTRLLPMVEAELAKQIPKP